MLISQVRAYSFMVCPDAVLCNLVICICLRNFSSENSIIFRNTLIVP